jgi:copper transport protein
MKAMIVTILAFGAAQAALAHTELAESVPADGAVVAAAPEEVQLRFSAAVRLTALAVQMDGTRKQSLGPLPAETAERFEVALPALDEGHYVVSWRALSEDTHVMSGEFMFVIGAGGHGQETNHAGAHGVEHAMPAGHAAHGAAQSAPTGHDAHGGLPPSRH